LTLFSKILNLMKLLLDFNIKESAYESIITILKKFAGVIININSKIVLWYFRGGRKGSNMFAFASSCCGTIYVITGRLMQLLRLK
jgi:hypothetical protein